MSRAFLARRSNQVALALVSTVVAVLVGLFGLTSVSFQRSQSVKYSAFRAQLADGSAPVDSPVRRGDPVAIVKAPAIDLDAVVLEGSDPRTLQKGVGHLRSSTLPGQKGTSVLLGKRSLFGGVFGDISQLAEGDQITVASAQGVTTYVVSEVKTFASDDAAAFAPSGDAIRLVTSTSSWSGGQRISVLAIAKDASAFPVGSRGVIEPISSDELGLNFDHSSAGALLAWFQVLVLIVLALTYLVHRWGWRRAWVFVSPVSLVVGVVVIMHVAAILPGLS